ncbi:hypothetical protein FJZ31_19455 [Candidatus Poribacteria bacterium]|nr:hypothetical protein [Candidatus Poribacteria bacterium]
MKTHSDITHLLNRLVRNEHDYYHKVVYPLLAILGVPEEFRWPQFPIKNPFGSGDLRIDYLLHVQDVPMVIVEAKLTGEDFTDALRQARNYARNFETKIDEIRNMTVPFLLVAAGGDIGMFRATPKGINIEYEPLDGFWEWNEILSESQIFEPRDIAQLDFLRHAVAPPTKPIVRPEILQAKLAEQFFFELSTALKTADSLKDIDGRDKDDAQIMLMNRIIRAARIHNESEIDRACQEIGVDKITLEVVKTSLRRYQQKFTMRQFEGPAVARAFREFVSKSFTGESRSLPVRYGKGIRYEDTARYFTPTEIIQQMVRLCHIQPTDKVIDFTCGSGGFLAEAAMSVPDEIAGDFLVNNVVGVDIDPFCVETARTLLGFLFPDRANEVKVFLHNGLYAKPHYKRYSDDRKTEPYLADGQYDVVIGNPPGNKFYSGGNERYVFKLWEERYGTIKHKWDHVFFVRRAIELTKPGGRICLLVPDGFIANDQFQDLRNEFLRKYELRAVISLPRVFKNNNAKMSILYLAKNPLRHPLWQVMMASVPARVERPSEDGEIEWGPTNILAELEGIGELFEVVTAENAELPEAENA